MSDWFGILLTFFLLLVNAFFVGAEFSLIAARRDRLEALLAQGKKRARTVINASEHLSMMLAAAQLGITIASLLLGKVSEPALAHLLEAPFQAMGIPESLLHPLSFAIALMLVSVLHIMLGEMVPKNIALAGPETMAMLLIPVHMVFYRLTKPLLLLFNWMARHTLRLFGIEQRDELDTTVDSTELASMIAESRQEGLLDSEEHVRLRRTLASATRTIEEVLIPHEQIRRLPTAPTVGDLETAVTETGFSRFPVAAANNEPNEYRGYVHVKDVLDRVMDPTSGPETAIPDDEIRPMIEIPIDATLDEGLRIMRRYSAHMAVAVRARMPKPHLRASAPASIAPKTGAFSGAEQIGIVALEDLIEEQVGVVRDWTHEVSPKRSAAEISAKRGAAKAAKGTTAKTTRTASRGNRS
ncbi:hemolysin family protein [Corynebacterium amycolatum]|uniref:Hemolysin family protein n=1 Tax=Corynebacterium amycolatum TaxID=43765 RepID=A0AAW9SZQ7_CORAY|nr:hemolysin family protein [Corynebacterium amycolatum]MDK7237709.1 hemolysin family protein [Corynebacterium amycolatum]MDK7247672.1 hemolysin family protein [Corynebacterium amycolatum]